MRLFREFNESQNVLHNHPHTLVALTLAVCLYGDANLCKLDVHSIFEPRGEFRTQSNIYDEALCKIS